MYFCQQIVHYCQNIEVSYCNKLKISRGITWPGCPVPGWAGEALHEPAGWPACCKAILRNALSSQVNCSKIHLFLELFFLHSHCAKTQRICWQKLRKIEIEIENIRNIYLKWCFQASSDWAHPPFHSQSRQTPQGTEINNLENI